MAEAHMDAGSVPHAGDHAEGQQHPIRIYLIVWFWLFVLSACSYLVDLMQLQGYLRWGLILLLMFAKVGLIIAVFMHMVWERAALAYAIIVPPLVLLVFLALMASEADYTFLTRTEFFGAGPSEPTPVVH